jgi:sortase A
VGLRTALGAAVHRLIVVLLLAGGLLTGSAAWVPAKAVAAQWLLDRAWRQTLDGGGLRAPWPWADTYPIARLQLDRLQVDQVVLAGASGRVLAFGPGWVEGTRPPAEPGNSVISGHRDTHFRWLKRVRSGDSLRLQLADGSWRDYRIEQYGVHHEDAGWLLDPGLDDRLRLLTCYPFDAVDPGTPWRFVVTAIAGR